MRNAGLVNLASAYLDEHPVPAEVRLDIAERLLEQAQYHEEVMWGFALLREAVRGSFDHGLLDRCRSWWRASSPTGHSAMISASS